MWTSHVEQCRASLRGFREGPCRDVSVAALLRLLEQLEQEEPWEWVILHERREGRKEKGVEVNSLPGVGQATASQGMV